MKACIRAIEYFLPEKVLTNADLYRENPDWNMELLEKKTGVFSRHVVTTQETALDLAYQACLELFDKEKGLKEKIDGLIFCTQFPDYILPANCFVLHAKLEMSESIFSFNYNLGCSGYVYGLAMAKSFIESGMLSNILLVNADTTTKYINPKDRSTRMLFGDAGTACWISAEGDNSGIGSVACATYGSYYDKLIIPAGGCRLPYNENTKAEIVDKHGNVNTKEHINMNGFETLEFVNTKVKENVEIFMNKNGISFQEIDLIIMHQASKVAMESLISRLSIPREKCFSNISHVGNLGSCSIPVAIKDAIDIGALSKGQSALLISFGVGYSSAFAVVGI